MEIFVAKKDIPVMRHALKFNILSGIVFALAIFFIVVRGLNFSVEFTGGTVMELNFPEPPQVEDVREVLSREGFGDAQVQNFGSSRDILIRMPSQDDVEADRLSEHVMEALAALDVDTPTLQRVEFVGPQVGEELAADGGMALLFVFIGITIYLALRFEWRFSVGAIVANFHDVLIILGFFAFFQWEFSLAVLAAILAVLGYSVNETVVLFDRVRESFKKKRNMNTPQILDHAITQTLSRTIITHTLTLMVVLSMLIFGGETLHYFALALTIGILFGIYSSNLVSTPVVMWLGVSREQFIKPKKEKEEAVV